MKVLNSCNWKKTKAFWEGTSRAFAGRFAVKKDRTVKAVIGYHFVAGLSFKSMFDTTLYISELKSLASSIYGHLTVEFLFTHPAMTGADMNSATIVARTRAELLTYLDPDVFATRTTWRYGKCSKNNLRACKAEKAIEEGNPKAMNNLGWMYKHGQGVAQNYKKAKELYEKAVEKGHRKAMNNLAFMYQNGQGMAQNYKKAKELYEKAVEKGYRTAMNNLGVMYQNGQGVAQNYKKAKELYEKAVEKGYPMAMNNLGYLYKNGLGVAQNYQKAKELFQKAVEKGKRRSMYHLGVMYQNGQGVPKDIARACHFFGRANAAGDQDAGHQLRILGCP